MHAPDACWPSPHFFVTITTTISSNTITLIIHNCCYIYCGAGQTMLHRRQDDIRLLKLEVAEAQRRVLVTGKLRGIIPGLDLDMASLQKQLLETRRSADELALQLESPDNKTRSPPCLVYYCVDVKNYLYVYLYHYLVFFLVVLFSFLLIVFFCISRYVLYNRM